MSGNVSMRFVSSMEKVFPGKEPGRPIERISALKNERLNFQLVVISLFERKGECKWKIKGALAPYARVRIVDFAKGYYNNRPDSDDYVIFHDCGVTLYPEILRTPDYTDYLSIPTFSGRYGSQCMHPKACLRGNMTLRWNCAIGWASRWRRKH